MSDPGTLSISAVVSPNGVGHLYRVVEVLRCLRARVATRVTLLLSQRNQVRSLGGEAWLDEVLGPVSLEEAGPPASLRWSPHASFYAEQDLTGWSAALRDNPSVTSADLVISDNLAGTLEARPDAILMGSFLWSDVLDAVHAGVPAVAAFVRHERALLERHRPPMLCISDVVMPGVLARTDAVRLPWMCGARRDRVRAPGRVVGFMGGMSGTGREPLLAAADVLVEAGFEVKIGSALRGGTGARHGLTREALADVDVIVCRPGVGTITDCITNRVPIVLVREAGNAELEHNAARLVALGIAIDPGVDAQPAAITRAVRSLLDGGGAEAQRRRMDALATDGLARAADWILAEVERRGIAVRRSGR